MYRDDPYEDGIMEAENLIEKDDDSLEPKAPHRGPFRFSGSDLFICTHRVGEFKCVLNTYLLPDS